MILDIAACEPDSSALPHHEKHHELVEAGVRHIVHEEKRVGGQLGPPSGARFRTYTRLKEYAADVKDTLFDTTALHLVINDIYKYPLRRTAVDTFNRQLRAGIDNVGLALLAVTLRDEDKLCIVNPQAVEPEPRIICSMGLIQGLL